MALGSLSRRRLAGAAVALALLGAAGIWEIVSRRGGSAEGRLGADATDTTSAEKGPGAATTPTLAGRRATPIEDHGAPVPSKGGSGVDGERDAPLNPGEGPVRLTLHLVGGAPPPRVIGVVAFSGDERESPTELRVAGSAPEGRLPRSSKYSFSITMDGWCSDQSWDEVQVPADDAITLEVRLPVQPVLEVVDAATLAPVAGAYAASVTWLDGGPPRAAPVGPSVEGEDSLDRRVRVRGDETGRIVLPRTARAGAWWVGGPGHAWKTLEVSTEQPMTRVPLEPGGGIHATVDGFAELEDPRVVVTRPSPSADPAPAAPAGRDDRRAPEETAQDVDMEPGASPGQFVIDGLPPGRWKVVVGRKGGVFLKEVYGAASAEVVAGRVAEVVVQPVRATRRVRVDVDLDLVVSEGWRGEHLGATLVAQGSRNQGFQREIEVAGESIGTVQRIHLTGVPPGPYQFSVAPLDWSCLVRVKVGGAPQRIEVPAPASVGVRVLDEAGKPMGRGAEVVVVQRTPWDEDDDPDVGGIAPSAEDEGPEGWSIGETQLHEDATRGVFAGRVASGPVKIRASAPGHLAAEVPLTLLPGAAERAVEVRLQRGATLEVRIVREGKLLTDVLGDVSIGPVREDGGHDGSWSRSSSLRDGKATFDGLSPGTLYVLWDRGSGQEPVERRVAMRIGETATVEMEVKK